MVYAMGIDHGYKPLVEVEAQGAGGEGEEPGMSGNDFWAFGNGNGN